MAGKRPKRPSTATNTTSASAKATTTPKKKQRFTLKQLNETLHSKRFQVAVGAILLLFVIFLIISFISFFFTGKQDFSVLDRANKEHLSVAKEIVNWGGVPGAKLTHFFVQNTFGIASIALYVLMAIVAIHLAHISKICNWKRFFICLFFMLWGSTALSFIQYTLFARSEWFFYFGGAHGEFASAHLIQYTHILGTALILIATALIFFIIVDPLAIEHLKTYWEWHVKLAKKLKALIFKKKEEKEELPENTNEPKIETLIGVVDDPSKTSMDYNNFYDDNNAQPIQIKLDDQPSEPATEPTDNIQIEIQQPQEVEIAEPAPKEPEIEVVEPVVEEVNHNDPDYILKTQGPYDPKKDLLDYHFPPTTLLKVYDNETQPIVNKEELFTNKNRIIAALRSFDIEIQSISATVGPTITLYEIVLKAGTRISKIQALEKDLMAALAAKGIRIIAPIPGKNAVGIEVPNEKPQIVSMHSVIASKKFQEEKEMALPIAIGKTITNEIFMFDLAKTPHLLVAGATGMGKSVGLNAILTSLLYKKHPAEMKLVLIDPKMVEFAPYALLARHYLATIPNAEKPIITESNKTIETLNSLVQEMEDRYRLLEAAGCRKLEEYNAKFVNRRLNPNEGHRYMPYIVIVIDEFGDFIMVAGKEVEKPIQRIAQKARAVGMHMILATQRPTVSIITGNIKANVPTRIAFRVQSLIDSRTVLDTKGAEQLVYKGDMLYSGDGKDPVRIQCAFVDTPEVEQILEHVGKQHGYAGISYELPEYVPENNDGGGAALAPGAVDLKRLDPMFTDVARYVVQTGQGGTTNLQRKFAIGFQKAGRLMDQLEAAGVVGPQNGSKPRQVLIQDEDELEALLRRLF